MMIYFLSYLLAYMPWSFSLLYPHIRKGAVKMCSYFLSTEGKPVAWAADEVPDPLPSGHHQPLPVRQHSQGPAARALFSGQWNFSVLRRDAWKAHQLPPSLLQHYTLHPDCLQSSSNTCIFLILRVNAKSASLLGERSFLYRGLHVWNSLNLTLALPLWFSFLL